MSWAVLGFRGALSINGQQKHEVSTKFVPGNVDHPSPGRLSRSVCVDPSVKENLELTGGQSVYPIRDAVTVSADKVVKLASVLGSNMKFILNFRAALEYLPRYLRSITLPGDLAHLIPFEKLTNRARLVAGLVKGPMPCAPMGVCKQPSRQTDTVI